LIVAREYPPEPPAAPPEEIVAAATFIPAPPPPPPATHSNKTCFAPTGFVHVPEPTNLSI
jgi:hypothetical protein